MPFGFLFFVCLGGQTYTTSESEFLLPLSRVIVTTKASKQGELEDGGRYFETEGESRFRTLTLISVKVSLY